MTNVVKRISLRPKGSGKAPSPSRKTRKTTSTPHSGKQVEASKADPNLHKPSHEKVTSNHPNQTGSGKPKSRLEDLFDDSFLPIEDSISQTQIDDHQSREAAEEDAMSLKYLYKAQRVATCGHTKREQPIRNTECSRLISTVSIGSGY